MAREIASPRPGVERNSVAAGPGHRPCVPAHVRRRLVLMKREPTAGVDDGEVELVEYLLSLTPAERMRRHDAALQLVAALRKGAVAHYGFDPRTAAAPERREG